jgi:hypothetical protein
MLSQSKITVIVYLFLTKVKALMNTHKKELTAFKTASVT